MISCKEYVAIQKQKLKEIIEKSDRKPTLYVVQIGNDSASNSYIKGKRKDCEEIGIEFKHTHIANYEDVSQEFLETMLKSLNANSYVDGIIIQLPIPDKYDIESLQKCISPEKDVDGFRRDSLFDSCTPKGIMDWLDYNEYDLSGKNVVVIGRSKIVGKPLVNMLIDKGATVTCCNSHTKDICFYTIYADVVISAVGCPKLFGWSCFSKFCDIVVDVGINRDKYGKLCGDINPVYFDELLPDTYLTPVPGGVGLLTRLALLKNVVDAYTC